MALLVGVWAEPYIVYEPPPGLNRHVYVKPGRRNRGTDGPQPIMPAIVELYVHRPFVRINDNGTSPEFTLKRTGIDVRSQVRARLASLILGISARYQHSVP
jgi:hypothetical protein